MTDKNLDEFLYLTGQALDIKALDEREPEVVFSKAYEKKKQEVLNMVRDIDSTVEPLPKVQKIKREDILKQRWRQQRLWRYFHFQWVFMQRCSILCLMVKSREIFSIIIL